MKRRPRPRTTKSLAIQAMTTALSVSKYDQAYDKAIEMIVALDKAGLKVIRKPLKRKTRLDRMTTVFK